jgi:hypothetical protein
MIVVMCSNHSIHTLSKLVIIYIRGTCSQSIDIWMVVGLTTSVQVKL